MSLTMSLRRKSHKRYQFISAKQYSHMLNVHDQNGIEVECKRDPLVLGEISNKLNNTGENEA